MGWVKPQGLFKRIEEVVGRSLNYEPVELYRERYKRAVPDLCEEERKDPIRFRDEIFTEMEKGSSVLIFGAGHSYNVNIFSDYMESPRITSWDFVEEASIGLKENIRFVGEHVLQLQSYDLDLIGEYDYVFTSHTLEHFTREQLLFSVLPKLFLSARKGLYIVVPYGDNWASEETHKCRFYENDELASMSYRYKRIRGGVEIVYHIKVSDD